MKSNSESWREHDTPIANTASRISICICTFGRRELLRKLLDSIAGLRFDRVPAPLIEIVVVDNDAQATAQEVCNTAALPYPLTYLIEPKRGITYARNRAIAHTDMADFVAFLDDDEVPAPEWLDELLWAQKEFSAEVVSGPVLSKYSPQLPDWIKNGNFFNSRARATGTRLKTCATNNALVATRVFKRVPGFDHAFALSGAEDTDFFLRVSHAGFKIIWSQEAVVFESVPANRGTISWILRREYQTGNGWVFCEQAIDKRWYAWIARLSKACGHILIGSTNTIWSSLMFQKADILRSLRRVSLGSGMLAALAGFRFQAYKTPTMEKPGMAIGRLSSRY
jgi:succinoglycan biosynthesis protein ExoM